ncbi:MAG: HNH endonuclease [Bacteroidales bacterium]|nr:HNH endonuclease [Bacteroidales bacterium]MBN2819255.1 HNH endonuclease [Bacteroidales bacterium]
MADKTFWDEIWKPVFFKGISQSEKYEISNYGRIKRWIPKENDWVVQKPSNVNGYAYFSFKTEESVLHKKRTTKSLHRLVAEEYLPKPKGSQDNVIHIDFNKWNNHVNNLQWSTREEMFKHSRKSPRTAAAIERRKGEITNSKLTETEVMRLKKKLKRGKTPLYKIAKEFGITHTQLNRIRRGENWAHIKID